MGFFNLPLELIELIFLDAVKVRTFKRAMRLRLVNRQFKYLVDDAIFRTRLLDDVATSANLDVRNAVYHTDAWTQYLRSYLTRLIFEERNLRCVRSQYRRVAARLCEASSKMQCVQEDALDLRACIHGLGGAAFFINSTLETAALLQSSPPPANAMLFSDAELDTLFLNAAVYMGLLSVVKPLLSADPNDYWACPTVAASKKPCLRSLLDMAAFRGDLDMLKHLLVVSRNVTKATTTSDLSPNAAARILRYAALGGNPSTIDFALNSSGPSCLAPDLPPPRAAFQQMRLALKAVASPAHYRRACALLNPGSRLFTNREHGDAFCRLAAAARCGHTDMVRFFLAQGVSPNPRAGRCRGSGPAATPRARKSLAVEEHCKSLVSAVESGCLEIVDLLLAHGADPNVYPPTATALMTAVHRGHGAIVRGLLDQGAHVNEGSPPPLVVAVQQEDVASFRYLESRGAELTPETGAGAMGYAVRHGLESMVDLLARRGIERDAALCHVPSWDEVRFGRYLYRGGEEPCAVQAQPARVDGKALMVVA
ncbi:Uu.00g125860.m01.CDS01 [Anthostomella pinea]|uniref:Uu.00g125860.m01.CDS01 n=1 Tax=Anthostomella pinea TaxID=933095 RepID=A0AAI8YHV7_9PEZI|nr:Uu.00g125860.m01.CDS01 [Anthostomella pinea]